MECSQVPIQLPFAGERRSGWVIEEERADLHSASHGATRTIGATKAIGTTTTTKATEAFEGWGATIQRIVGMRVIEAWEALLEIEGI